MSLKSGIIDDIIRTEGGYVNDPSDIEKAIKSALLNENRKHSLKIYKPENSRDYECIQNDCGNQAYAKGYCNAHYIRYKKGKNMSMPLRNRSQSTNCIICNTVITSKGGFSRCPKHFKKRRCEIIKQTMVDILGGKCSKCKHVHPLPVYDFHHVNKKEKIYNVGTAIATNSIEKLSIEVSKCILLCANCHRIEHND